MSGADVLVLCEKAALTFGRDSTAVVAVHGTDLSIRAGDRLAIVGPSGSGKSSLLHLLAGLERPTSGAVSWPGLGGSADIGLVFQADSLVPALDVAQNTALPLVLPAIRRRRRVVRSPRPSVWSGRPTSPTGCPRRSPAARPSGSPWPAFSPRNHG